MISGFQDEASLNATSADFSLSRYLYDLSRRTVGDRMGEGVGWGRGGGVWGGMSVRVWPFAIPTTARRARCEVPPRFVPCAVYVAPVTCCIFGGARSLWCWLEAMRFLTVLALAQRLLLKWRLRYGALQAASVDVTAPHHQPFVKAG